MLGSALDVGISCSAGARVFGRKELGFGDSPLLQEGGGRGGGEGESNEMMVVSFKRAGRTGEAEGHNPGFSPVSESQLENGVFSWWLLLLFLGQSRSEYCRL